MMVFVGLVNLGDNAGASWPYAGRLGMIATTTLMMKILQPC